MSATNRGGPTVIGLIALSGCDPVVTVALTDANNFAFTSAIEAEAQPVASRKDTPVDWSGLDLDLLGAPVDPTSEVTEVRLVQFADLTRAEVLKGINEDTLVQSDLSAFASYAPTSGETSALLTAFSLFGTAVDPAEHVIEGGGTYLVGAVTGASQYRMLAFFAPSEAAEAAPIVITGDSASLTWAVDLDRGEPVRMDPGARVLVDWRGLTRNGSDLPIDLSDVDRLLLARYDEPIAEIEADFLRVEVLAEASWQADVSGWGDWPLDDLEAADGTPFPGFEGEGTWLLALMCGTCINPAPPFLAVLAFD